MWRVVVGCVLLVGCGSDDVTEQATESASSDSSADGQAPTTEPGDSTTSSMTASGDGSTGSGSTTGSASGWEAPIEWVPCPIYTGGMGQAAHCATVEMPLDWDDFDAGTIELFVKRIGGGDGSQQLWLLQGGPGGAGNAYEGMADGMTAGDPALDAYLIDHRGTGRSSRLGCPDQEAAGSFAGASIDASELPDCIDHIETTWGDDLFHFTTTAAARDLGWFIDQVREPRHSVHVFGGSYGTYWAQRYIQVFPDQPDGVTLLGVVSPSFSFSDYDVAFNQAGLDLLEHCGTDLFCVSKLGADPVAMAQQLVVDLGAGHCPEAGIAVPALQSFLGSVLAFQWDSRPLITSLLYRLRRCDAGDIVALQTAAPQMQGATGGILTDPLFSQVINYHVSMSEMWHPPIPTEAEAQAVADTAVFYLGSTSRRLPADGPWPTYPPDEYEGGFADSTVPILMLEGEFDPNSPLPQAMEVGANYTAPGQRFVVLPGGNHTFASPTAAGGDCAFSLFLAFLAGPTELLPDCTGQILPVDYVGDMALAQQFYGTDDLYEN